jgi:hypothetical protein
MGRSHLSGVLETSKHSLTTKLLLALEVTKRSYLVLAMLPMAIMFSDGKAMLFRGLLTLIAMLTAQH